VRWLAPPDALRTETTAPASEGGFDTGGGAEVVNAPEDGHAAALLNRRASSAIEAVWMPGNRQKDRK
jgi:hypothetical protein